MLVLVVVSRFSSSCAHCFDSEMNRSFGIRSHNVTVMRMRVESTLSMDAFECAIGMMVMR